MRAFIMLCLLFSVSAVYAGRPPSYDANCFTSQFVESEGGGSYIVQHPDFSTCKLHGTYYRVRLHIGSIKAGQVAIFTEGEYPTITQAEAKRLNVENENSGFCRTSDVKVTVEPINF